MPKFWNMSGVGYRFPLRTGAFQIPDVHAKRTAEGAATATGRPWERSGPRAGSTAHTSGPAYVSHSRNARHSTYILAWGSRGHYIKSYEGRPPETRLPIQ